MNKLYRFALITAVLVSMAGCATTQVNKQAFARRPRLAVITISGAAHGVFTSDKEDLRILKDTVPTCLHEIAKSRHLRLLPARAALSKSAYAEMKNTGATFSTELVPGYKNISLNDEKQHLHKLARELHVDGFIILYLIYGQEDSFGIGIGPIGIGAKKPTADVGIATVDPDGKTIWQTNEHIRGDHGIVAVNGIGNYSAIISRYNALTKTVCDLSVQDLNKNLASR